MITSNECHEGRSEYDAHHSQANREDHDIIHGDRLPSISVPKLRIEGTHKPTNTPSSLLPENHSQTDSTKEIAAANKKPAFASCSLLIAFSL